jgi:hypothetical protein
MSTSDKYDVAFTCPNCLTPKAVTATKVSPDHAWGRVYLTNPALHCACAEQFDVSIFRRMHVDLRHKETGKLLSVHVPYS